ncbi:MAG TPA: HEAT repeat domain-containing protein [Vicinamibacterales bacterium]|nr:HEAT repeat domain-containing protein [Vicinamibacterales bacterium]
MSRLLPLSLAAVVFTAPSVPPASNVDALAREVQQAAVPVDRLIQNGKVEHRPGTAIAREVSSLSGVDATWIGWQVPMVDGRRDMCSWWSTDNWAVRGQWMEPTSFTGGERPQIAQPAGPVPLEAGTNMLVLLRVVRGEIERMHLVTGDCPLDAGGRTVVWLDAVPAAESLRYLETLTALDTASPTARMTLDSRRSMASSAVGAIALHRDAGADAILDRLVGSTDNSLRRQAGSRLASYRGAHGFDVLRKLIGTERDQETRRSFVASLAQTRQPGTAEALLALARTDTDARVRAEAIGGYIRVTGSAGLQNALAVVNQDAEDSVKSRAISALASLPNNEGAPHLVTLARSNASPAVRRSAVSNLGRMTDRAAQDALLSFARTDTDPKVRSEAIYQYVRSTGEPGVANALSVMDKDADDAVKRRVVSAIAGLPNNTGVPHLITLARNNTNMAVRKEAVSALGRSKDPRATAYLEELIKR